MFSCVVAGRLPLPPPQQVDATHAVFVLEAVEQIQHIVVFMTGEQAFPEGYGATVHLMWPREDGSESSWQLLGWCVVMLTQPTQYQAVGHFPTARCSAGSRAQCARRDARPQY